MFGALPAGRSDPELVDTVRAALAEPLARTATAGLAVSGGPDSVALALLAVAARPDVRWCVVHVRHGLRDDDADAKAAFAAAQALDVPWVERAVDVPATSRAGVEALARRARYDAFRAVADAHGLTGICLGHTADDQAETVLLNLSRGSGTRGLAGMPPVRREGPVLLVRPLLRLRRADVRAHAERSGLPTVADPMNDDLARRRTRVRAEVLPALQRLSGGPGDPVGVLCRLADLAADDTAVLDELADEHLRAALRSWGPVRMLPSGAVDELPRAIGSRVVRGLLAAVRGTSAGLPASDVRAVLALAPGKARTVAGGIVVTRGGGWLAAAPARVAPLAARPLARDGADLAELGLRVVVDAHGEPADALEPVTPPWRRVDASSLSALVEDPAELIVRGPRQGERMTTTAGSVPVSGLLVDAGVARPARPLVPVVADREGRALWVPGIAAARRSAAAGGMRLRLARSDPHEYAARTDPSPPAHGG